MASLMNELLAELTREEAYLAEFEHKRDAVQSRVETLRAELAVLSADESTQPACRSQRESRGR